MKKICLKCKEEKDYACFAKQTSRKDGLQKYCRTCKKQYDANHYRNNKTKQLARNSRFRIKGRDEVRQYKIDRGCCFCGEKEACCLDFHHLDQLDKKFVISTSNNRYSKTVIWEEIAKCIVICANCHRKLHNGILKTV